MNIIFALFFVATITIRERTSRDKQEALLVVVYNFRRATIFVVLLKLSAKIQITSAIKKSSRVYRISNTPRYNRYFQ